MIQYLSLVFQNKTFFQNTVSPYNLIFWLVIGQISAYGWSIHRIIVGQLKNREKERGHRNQEILCIFKGIFKMVTNKTDPLMLKND